MKKLSALLFKFLPNDAHYRFFEKAVREVAAAGVNVQNAIGAPLIAELNSWFAVETADLDWYRKSQLTAAIAEADSRLDHALSGMSAQVSAARYSIHPNTAAAAERLHVMLHSFGNVTRKPYPEEISAVTGILDNLNGALAADAQTAGIAGWVTEATAALADFVRLFEQREAETLEKPQAGFPETRRNLDNIWHQITPKVNGGAALDLSPEFAAFIDKLNPEIEYLNKEYHRVKVDIAHSEPAPIERQPYTGRPCTPVPEVLYVTAKDGTIRLELGKDFNITYKNNVNPGNGECTLHGKGAYRGYKTVTFIVAR
jgi:hypothetical protein